jgi:hypothetical protein
MITHSGVARRGEEADAAGDGHFVVNSRPSCLCEAGVLLQALEAGVDRVPEATSARV